MSLEFDAKILVALQNTSLSEILAHSLIDMGFDSVQYSHIDAVTADALLDNNFDLIITGWNMHPDNKRFEFLRAIRSTDADSEVPLLLVIPDIDIERVIDTIGINGFTILTSPLDTELLKSKVSEALNGLPSVNLH